MLPFFIVQMICTKDSTALRSDTIRAADSEVYAPISYSKTLAPKVVGLDSPLYVACFSRHGLEAYLRIDNPRPLPFSLATVRRLGYRGRDPLRITSMFDGPAKSLA